MQMLHLKSVWPLLLTSALMACSSEPPVGKKQRLLNTMSAMETAIENKHLSDFFSHVSDQFSMKNGWGRKDAERLLRLRLMRNKQVFIHQAVKSIDWVDGGAQTAQVVVVVAMAGTEFSLTDLPSFRGELARFEVTFDKSDDAYQVTQAEWKRATPADFL